MISSYDKHRKSIKHLSANACLTPVCSLDGCAVTTIEGIGGMKQGLHPVQKRVAEMHGSQCGFCTPGIVMSLYAQLRSHPDSTPHQLEDALDGNLCRCTGYRPIIDAARSLSNRKGDDKSAKETVMGDTVVADASQLSSRRGCCGGASGGCACAASQMIMETSEGALFSNPSLDEEMATRQLTEPIFPPFLMTYEPQFFRLSRPSVGPAPVCTWLQPVSLAQLHELKRESPQARLVVGNTEVGIEVHFKGMEYDVLVNPSHIPELGVIQVLQPQECAAYVGVAGGNSGGCGLLIGAAVSVNQARECMAKLHASTVSSVSGGTDADRYQWRGLRATACMLDWFASNQIRNMACIGGNIVTASPISDLNPMLLACGAVLKLSSHSGERLVPVSEFFLSYRRVNMQPEEVLQSVFVPSTEQFEFVVPFKQARRREDDISIVTAGMRVRLAVVDRVWVIADAGLAFGGMAPTTVLARRTAAVLCGKPWNMGTVEATYDLLREEMDLPVSVPGGQAEYRMALCLSFLFKAYLTITNELSTYIASLGDAASMSLPPVPVVDTRDLSGSFNFVTTEKPATRGEQHYTKRSGGLTTVHGTTGAIPRGAAVAADGDSCGCSSATGGESSGEKSDTSPIQPAANDRGIVGESVMHLNAQQQVSGAAQYTWDTPLLPSTVHACLVTSTRAHAQLLNVDISEAQRCDGFVAYYGAKDIRGDNKIGAIVKDEEVFATTEVKHYGAVSTNDDSRR